MKKRRIVVLIAVSLSLLYSFSYICISSFGSHQVEKLYVVQVGAFSSSENASQLIEKIQALDHPIFTYNQDGLEYVLTLVSQNEQEVDQEMNYLQLQQIDHVKREYKLDRKDPTIETLLSFLSDEK